MPLELSASWQSRAKNERLDVKDLSTRTMLPETVHLLFDLLVFARRLYPNLWDGSCSQVSLNATICETAAVPGDRQAQGMGPRPLEDL